MVCKALTWRKGRRKDGQLSRFLPILTLKIQETLMAVESRAQCTALGHSLHGDRAWPSGSPCFLRSVRTGWEPHSHQSYSDSDTDQYWGAGWGHLPQGPLSALGLRWKCCPAVRRWGPPTQPPQPQAGAVPWVGAGVAWGHLSPCRNPLPPPDLRGEGASCWAGGEEGSLTAGLSGRAIKPVRAAS